MHRLVRQQQVRRGGKAAKMHGYGLPVGKQVPVEQDVRINVMINED
ncbi:MAG: hypothetical protein HOM11_11380 [Methylococcales bacterium]|nr:hypothetical protein [Methylococcales bacterium]MBT7443356.1 hypothetical protein [Methylococcales bacterium]